MDLSGRIKRGVFWVGLSTVAVRVLSLTAYFVLASKLVPEAFGLVAGANLALDALNLFQEMGFGSALIYRKDDIEDAAYTAFFPIITTAVISYGVAFAIAPWLSAVVKQPDPEIIPVLRVLALNMIIASFARVPMVLLAKELDFRRRVLPDVVPSLIYAILATILAYAGLGVWSIVYARLASTAVRAVAAWLVTGWRPRLRFVPRLARELFDYGKHIIASQLLVFGITNIDDMFVLRMLGFGPEGQYDLAYRTSNLPATQITGLVNQVMFPAFAKMQDDLEAFRRTYFQALRYVSFLAFPLAVGTVVFAPDLVAAIDPEKWGGAVLPLQLLGVYGLLRSVAGNMGNVFKGGGKPQWLTGIALWRFITMAVLLYPATRWWGIVGVSGLSAAVAVVDFAISGTLANKVIDTTWRDYGRLLLPVLLMSGIAGALAWFVVWLVPVETGIWSLLLGGAVLLVTYGLALWRTQPDLRTQAIALWQGFVRRRRAAQNGA